MKARFDTLVVGAGHGGAQLATVLRQRGYSGSIALLGAEPELPYERPALSKEYLAGTRDIERIRIRPAAFWAERQVELLLGRRVVAVGPADRHVLCDDGTRIGYGSLVWSAGGTARRLGCPGGDLAGIHTMRSRADVDRIIGQLPVARRITVVGGGHVGLEAAAGLAKQGRHVTLIEAQDRVLNRVTGEVLSRFYEAEHRRHGVDIRLLSTVVHIEGRAGTVCGVRLHDGESIPCDMVIVGIGIVPAVAPLLAAGAAGDNGVDVDESCRTTLPGVFAIGDCASHANPFADGARIRLESVQNANDQATTVARSLTGDPAPYHAVPWFWSNQYDLKLQTVGLSAGHDQAVIRGDPAARRFSQVYLKLGRVIALDCVNTPLDYVQGRSLVLAGACLSPEDLADPARPLRPARVGAAG